MASSPVSPAGGSGATPRSDVWELLLQGRPNLKPTDVQQVCDRFRRFRGGDEVSLSDALLTPEELAEVLGVDGGAAAVLPLFKLLCTDAGGSSGGSHCDLRVLLVAMAGLTRKKAVDRMRFAALLLDEAETGYLTDEQLALVLHANSLLDPARVERPALHSSLTAKARDLVRGTAGTEDQGSSQLSHDVFLELVRKSPQELCISPDKRRGRGALSSAATSVCPSPRSPVLGASTPLAGTLQVDPASSSTASTPSPSKLQLAAAAAAARLNQQNSSSSNTPPTTTVLGQPKDDQREGSTSGANQMRLKMAARRERLEAGNISPSTSSSQSPSKFQLAAAAAAARLCPPTTEAASNSAASQACAQAGDISPSTSTSPSPSKLQLAAAAAAARLCPPTTSAASNSAAGGEELGGVHASSTADSGARSATTAWGVEAEALPTPIPTSPAATAAADSAPDSATTSPGAKAAAATVAAAAAEAVAEATAETAGKPGQPQAVVQEATLPLNAAVAESSVEVEAASAPRSASQPRTSARSTSQPRTAGTPPRSAGRLHTTPEALRPRSTSRPRTPQDLSELAFRVSVRAAEKAAPLSPATAAHPDLRMAPLPSASPGGSFVATPPLTPKAPRSVTPRPSNPPQATTSIPATAWANEDLTPGYPVGEQGDSPGSASHASVSPHCVSRTASRGATPPRTASRGAMSRTTSRGGTPRTTSRHGTPRSGIAAVDFRRLPLNPGAAHDPDAAPPPVSGWGAPGPPPRPGSGSSVAGQPANMDGITPIPSGAVSTGWATPRSNQAKVTPSESATPRQSRYEESTPTPRASLLGQQAAAAASAARRARPGTPQDVQDLGTPTPREEDETPSGLRTVAAKSFQVPAPPAPLVGALRAAGGFRQGLPTQPDTGLSAAAEQAEVANHFPLPTLPQCQPLSLPAGLPSQGLPPSAPPRPPPPPPAGFAPPPPPPPAFAAPPPPAVNTLSEATRCIDNLRAAGAAGTAFDPSAAILLPGTPRHESLSGENLLADQVISADALPSAVAQNQRTPPQPPSADFSIASLSGPASLDPSMSLTMPITQPSTQKPPTPPAQTQLAGHEPSVQDVRTTSKPPTPRTKPPKSPRKDLMPPPLPTESVSCVDRTCEDMGADSSASRPPKSLTLPTASPQMPLLPREPWSGVEQTNEVMTLGVMEAPEPPKPPASSICAPGMSLQQPSEELNRAVVMEAPGPPKPPIPPEASSGTERPTEDLRLPRESWSGIERQTEELRTAAVMEAWRPASSSEAPVAPKKATRQQLPGIETDLPGTPRHATLSKQELVSDEVTPFDASILSPTAPPEIQSQQFTAEVLSLPTSPASPLQKPPMPPISSVHNSAQDLQGQQTSSSVLQEERGDAGCANNDLRAAAFGSVPVPASVEPPPLSFTRPPTPLTEPPPLPHRTSTPPPLPPECLPHPVQPSAVECVQTSTVQSLAAEADLPGTPRHTPSVLGEAAAHRPAGIAGPEERCQMPLAQQPIATTGAEEAASATDNVQRPAAQNQATRHDTSLSGRNAGSGQRLFTPRSGRGSGSSRSAPKPFEAPEAPSLSARLANYVRGRTVVHPVSSAQADPPSPQLPPGPDLQLAPPGPAAAEAETADLPPGPNLRAAPSCAAAEVETAALPPGPNLQPAPSGAAAEVETTAEPQEAASVCELQETPASTEASIVGPTAAQLPSGGLRRITGHGCPPRQQKRPAHVPPLDLSSVMRIIDGEPAGTVAESSPAADLESPASSSAGDKLSPGRGLVAEAEENEQNDEGLEFYFIGSEGGSSSPSSSKAASVTALQREGAAVEEQIAAGKKEDEDLELGMGLTPDWADWTYGRYLVEQQRRTVLKWVSCGPMRAGQRRLLVIALVLLQVAILLFVLDAGGIGGATASAVGYRIREAQIVLAIFAGCAAVVTLCFCGAGLWDNLASEAREVGLGGLTPSDETSETTPALRVGRGVAKRAAGHESRYKEMLRRMKEQSAQARSEDKEVSSDLLEPVQEPLGSVAISADEVGEFANRSANVPEENPRTWPGPDRRRYSQLKGGDDEASTSGPALRAVGARGLRMPSRRLAPVAISRGGGSGRALKSAPRAGAGAEEVMQGWA